jgi:predicted phosphodiesterase
MRIAALYDIHGNLPALDAVLDELDADAIVVGGDLAPGALVGECLERLRALGARFVMGNGDREVLEGVQEHGAGWVAARLTAAQREALAAFEPMVRLGGALFCHGSPRSDTEIITRITPEERLAPMLEGVEEPLVVCGHTHQQFDRRVLGKRLVNAGSVGLPYEGVAAAFWLVVDGDEVELRRTGYDVTAAVARMRAADFTELDALLPESLLEPTDPDKVTEFFEGQATISRNPAS